jgi:hypothetical protein
LSIADFLLVALRGASVFAGFICSLIVSSPPTAISHMLIDPLQRLVCYLLLLEDTSASHHRLPKARTRDQELHEEYIHRGSI